MEDLVVISDVANNLGISSRTLRYYEEIGLIKSVRPKFETYRYYDLSNIERMKQISVLRKMQIPVKDIKRIYENRDMSVLVQVFVKNIESIDMKISSLNDLKQITNSFLQAMLENGVRQITALPILFEKMQQQMTESKEREFEEERELMEENVTYRKLEELAENIAPACELDIIVLPLMRVWSSKIKETGVSAEDEFYDWLKEQGILSGIPAEHTIFEYQEENGQTIILARKEAELDIAPYSEEVLEGGLFAVGEVYEDEDIEGYYQRMLKSLDENSYYQVDYSMNGKLRCPILAETVLSQNRQRDKVKLFLPVKRRLPDISLYDPGKNVTDITMEEMKERNQVLWTREVKLNAMTPILNPYYRMNEQGEAEFIPYISRRQLDTNVNVRLPFRVDMEFKIEEQEEQFRYGADEGSIRIYHGTNLFGINMENNSEPGLSQEAIAYEQPVFGDYRIYPKYGKIRKNEYNRLTWIIGESQLAVIINDEIRYCGVELPYMKTNLNEEPAKSIIIGGNGQGKIYLRSIQISQLKQTAKHLLKGDFMNNGRQSNNRLSEIHSLITMHYGENYWFNGCARYVMEAKGEKEFDYNFFAGLSGDIFAQYYTYHEFSGNSRTDYMLKDGKNKDFVERIFAACGYAASFVLDKELEENKEIYLQTLMAFIDRGIPVIWRRNDYPTWLLIVGYEEYGKTLLYITEEKTEPERVAADVAMKRVDNYSKSECVGWIFVGEKKKEVDIKQIYRDAIFGIKKLLTTKTEEYSLGAEAFRGWAKEIKDGRFCGMKPEEFDDWCMYKTYVCNAATNSTCVFPFLEKALELNPDLIFIKEIEEEYKKTKKLWDELEALGGGFGVSLETLQNPEKASAIAAKISEFADCIDRVVQCIPEE